MTRDLMFQDRIRAVVRDAYGSLPAGAGRPLAERFYSPAELAELPEGAVRWALGVGNPVRSAGLAPGETVLDLGCGGGIDTVLAAREVGPTGRVVGLDALPEMCARARRAAAEAGTEGWCEFRVGEMEAIPLPDASVDVVVSNGAINLSPRKSRTLAEIVRVLRPGGRLTVADLTVEDDLPPEVLGSEASWAGCIAGALSERTFVRKLHRAGLIDVDVGERVPFGVEDVALYPLFDESVLELMRRTIPPLAQVRVAVGVIVRATAPLRVAGAGATAAAGARRAPVRRLDDIAPAAAEVPGVTVRKLKRVDDVDLKALDIEPGGSTPFHTHVHAHEGVIVSGSGGLRLDDHVEPLRPGDVFSVDPTRPHAIESHGEAPLRLLCLDCFVE